MEGYEIFDKSSKSYRTIKIPYLPPNNNNRVIKKSIMQTIMDYKVLFLNVLILRSFNEK